MEPELSLTEILPSLRKMFSDPKLDKVAGGAPPRTSISDALVATFVEMLKIIRPSSVLEIGAHEASFSCTIKQVLPESNVIAFEANPHVFAIYGNTARLRKSGIRYIQSAVSDVDGEVDLIIPTSVARTKKPLHNMMGSLNRLSHPHTEDETISVTSVTLDHFLKDIQEQSLAVWIDVEGAVDRVLAGAQATMPKVQALICEVEDAPVWQGQTLDTEIVSRLRHWQLVPVLCDCQKRFQYNLIMLKLSFLQNPNIRGLINAFAGKASDLLRATVGG